MGGASASVVCVESPVDLPQRLSSSLHAILIDLVQLTPREKMPSCNISCSLHLNTGHGTAGMGFNSQSGNANGAAEPPSKKMWAGTLAHCQRHHLPFDTKWTPSSHLIPSPFRCSLRTEISKTCEQRSSSNSARSCVTKSKVP